MIVVVVVVVVSARVGHLGYLGHRARARAERKRREGGGQAAVGGRLAQSNSVLVSLRRFGLVLSLIAGARGEASGHLLQGVVGHACDEGSTRVRCARLSSARIAENVVVVVVSA